MGKEILVNVANRETRIAVIDDNQLVELRIEREEQVVGNIYKGRVENVLPGMDAAFVDVGLERNAFLYVADILPEYVDSDDDEAVDDEIVMESGVNAAAVNASLSTAVAPVSPAETVIDMSTAAVPAPREGGGQRSGSSQRNRSRRGGRPRRDEAELAAPAPESPSAPSAMDDYRRYLSDPDRESPSDDAEHALAFFDEIGTEDGFDLGDIAEQNTSDNFLQAEPSSEAVASIEDLDEDSEIEPNSLALAREAEEIFEEATTRVELTDGDYAELTQPEAAIQLPEAIAEAAMPGESASDFVDSADLDHDAVMVDAASAAEPDANAELASDTVPAEPEADVVRAPRSRPGGRRAGPVAEGGDGTNSKPINQAKRPMRRGGAPGGGGRLGGGRGFSRRHASIADLVQTKQELLLQVVKGPARHQRLPRLHPYVAAGTLPRAHARRQQPRRQPQNRGKQRARPP